MTTRPRQKRVERGQLSGYHRDLQDFVMKAVNHLGMECRIAQNRLMIYPPDDLPPITVYDRNSDRQMKSLNAWLADINSRDTLPGVALGLSEDESVDLATANLVRDLVRTAPEIDPMVQFALRGAQAQAEVDRIIEGEWVPWAGKDGPVEGWEYNGTIWRCTRCAEAGIEYTRPRAAGIGGHNRMKHSDTSALRTPEAQTKALWHKRYNRLERRVEKALLELTGQEVADPREVVRLRAANATLRSQNTRLRERLAKAIAARKDAEAALGLVQDSLRAWRAK